MVDFFRTGIPDTASPLARLADEQKAALLEQERRQQQSFQNQRALGADARADQMADIRQQEAARQAIMQELSIADERERQRIQNLYVPSKQLLGHLESGDIEAAKMFLQNNRRRIGQLMADGENVDTLETDYATEIINRNDPAEIQALTDELKGVIMAGDMLGVDRMASNRATLMGGATGALAQQLVEEGSAKNLEEALQIMRGGAGEVGKLQAKAELGKQAKASEKRGENVIQQIGKIEEDLPRLNLKKQQLERKTSFIEGEIGRAINILQDSTRSGRILVGDLPTAEMEDLKSVIDTIRANLGFDELRSIKESGATLGALSELENAMLQATQGSTNLKQRNETLINTLINIIEQRQAVLRESERFRQEQIKRLQELKGEVPGVAGDDEAESDFSGFSIVE